MAGNEAARSLRKSRVTGSRVAAGLAMATLVTLLIAFPGRRVLLAFTLATGLGRGTLQARIDSLEEKAIDGREFSVDDKRFLDDFYRTLATGARCTWALRQTAGLMRHYLDGSGADYVLDPSIFTENRKVSVQLSLLRKRALALPCDGGRTLSSPRFHMPDRSKPDSVYGLYDGILHVTPRAAPNGACRLHWRAEVPWFWPSYASLKQKYGSYHAESFPLPNALTLLLGRRHALYVDNGLGEALVHAALARPFLAYAEWDEARAQ